MTQIYDCALAPVGLGLNQYAILARAIRLGPIGISALADALVMDRSTLGHLLRPLETRGLVALTRSSRDRRGRSVVATEAGRALHDRAYPLWLDAETQFQTAFGSEAAAALRAMLVRVVAIRQRPDAAAADPESIA